MSFASDAAAMLRDFGVVVVHGTARTTGQLDALSREARTPDGMTYPATVRSLTLLTAWTDERSELVEGATLTVGGVSYVVHEAPRPLDDDVFSQLLVARSA